MTWVTILVGMVIFEFNFHRNKIYKNSDVVSAGVCIKQVCSLTPGEYDFISVAPQCFIYNVNIFYHYEKIAPPVIWILHLSILGF